MERKSDKHGMDKARWHQDVQAVKTNLLTPKKYGFFRITGKKMGSYPRRGRKTQILLT
ncbi:hypothetical protein [Salmonella enterica]|uniref:hypothetical protein n=1 Tax=Salmonella enterica TaxID=28901 RepID=UPI0017820886|nr:hypothetical protein [Salmonella enterica]MBD8446086.1 hypothetical protein [Salmonella enterica subsp. enterica serovar Typhi]